jgi:hypothetical protein
VAEVVRFQQRAWSQTPLSWWLLSMDSESATLRRVPARRCACRDTR